MEGTRGARTRTTCAAGAADLDSGNVRIALTCTGGRAMDHGEARAAPARGRPARRSRRILILAMFPIALTSAGGRAMDHGKARAPPARGRPARRSRILIPEVSAL